MNPNTAPLRDLLAQINRLNSVLDGRRKKQRKSVLDALITVMTENAITVQDLLAAGAPSRSAMRPDGPLDGRSVVRPKYRDPATGRTWSGRGRMPIWMTQAIKSGRKRKDFELAR